MDLSALDDIIARLEALRLTAHIAGLGDTIFGSLFTQDLPRLVQLRGELNQMTADDQAERRRLETALGQKL